MRLENELEEHKKQPPERGAKSLIVQNFKEKDAYLTFEVTTRAVVDELLVNEFYFAVESVSNVCTNTTRHI